MVDLWVGRTVSGHAASDLQVWQLLGNAGAAKRPGPDSALQNFLLMTDKSVTNYEESKTVMPEELKKFRRSVAR